MLVTQNNGMQLVNDDSLNSYLQMILEEFRNNPTDGRFLNILNPPLNGAMKSDFFYAEDFHMESSRTVYRMHLAMPGTQVHSSSMEIYIGSRNKGQKAKAHI